MNIYDFLLPVLHILMFLPCALVLTVMTLATWGSIGAKRDHQKSLSILGSLACPSCHQAFGLDAAIKAQEEDAGLLTAVSVQASA